MKWSMTVKVQINEMWKTDWQMDWQNDEQTKSYLASKSGTGLVKHVSRAQSILSHNKIQTQCTEIVHVFF